jgi:hypothetical protein
MNTQAVKYLKSCVFMVYSPTPVLSLGLVGLVTGTGYSRGVLVTGVTGAGFAAIAGPCCTAMDS